MWHELSDTLLALADSFDVPAGSGLVITAVELAMPLEMGSTVHNGHLVILASPPFTRYKSGVLPALHASHVTFELIGTDDVDMDDVDVGVGVDLRET